MLIAYNHLIKNFFFYSLSILAIRSLTFLPMPFILATITPAEFGLWSLFHNATTIIAILSSSGLRQVLYLNYVHHDTAGQKQFINTIIITYLTVCLPFFALLLLALGSYSSLFTTYQFLIIISLLCAFFSFFNDIFYQILRFHACITELVITQLLSALIQIGATLFFVLILRWSIIGMALGHLLGIATAFVQAHYAYIKTASFRLLKIPSWSTIFSFISLGLPFLPSLLSAFFLATSSRILLSYFANMHDVGIFAFADLTAQLFDLAIIQSLQSSYVPFIFNLYKTNPADLLAVEKWNKKIMFQSMAFLTTITIFLFYLLKPLVLFIIPAHYHVAINYVLPIMVGSIFLTGAHFACIFLQFFRHSYFLAVFWCLPACFTFCFSWLLIPTLKIYGCVLASSCACALSFFITLGYNFWVVRSMAVKSHTYPENSTTSA